MEDLLRLIDFSFLGENLIRLEFEAEVFFLGVDKHSDHSNHIGSHNLILLLLLWLLVNIANFYKFLITNMERLVVGLIHWFFNFGVFNLLFRLHLILRFCAISYNFWLFLIQLNSIVILDLFLILWISPLICFLFIFGFMEAWILFVAWTLIAPVLDFWHFDLLLLVGVGTVILHLAVLVIVDDWLYSSSSVLVAIWNIELSRRWSNRS